MESTQTDYISVINSILMLVDYKTDLLNQVKSGNRNSIKDAVVASAKAASILNVPVILMSSDRNGDYIRELRDIFPQQNIIIQQYRTG